jgi:hypothetical protein
MCNYIREKNDYLISILQHILDILYEEKRTGFRNKIARNVRVTILIVFSFVIANKKISFFEYNRSQLMARFVPFSLRCQDPSPPLHIACIFTLPLAFVISFKLRKACNLSLTESDFEQGLGFLY